MIPEVKFGLKFWGLVGDMASARVVAITGVWAELPVGSRSKAPGQGSEGEVEVEADDSYSRPIQ